MQTKEEIRKYLKDWRLRNLEKVQASNRRTTKAYAKKNPHKISAHRKIEYAIKRGYMTRKPCVICGEPITHAHHEDYSKPYDVVWLCNQHHVKQHQVEKGDN